MRTQLIATLASTFAGTLLPFGASLAAQSGGTVSARGAETVTVVPGARYAASGLHRFFFGNHYRELWATPITVPVLDLATYGGGLRPTRRGGGKQTKSLRFVGADGRKYSFRSLDKDPAPLLPPELRATLVNDIFQDQISASHPVGALVVPPLLEAAGVPHAVPELYVLPDDPALGPFRADFAGMLGMLEERPTEGDDDGPGFAGARKVADTDELFERMDRDSREQVDARAFLSARLVDLFLGDWDRHGKQWKWIKVDEGKRAPWLPVPYDRDQAFVRLDGVLLGIARQSYPQLVNFGDDYPSMLGLTWNGRALDRRLLTGLEWPVWDSTARALTARLTDSVIDAAVHRLPPEYFARDGERLARTLRVRRDKLPAAAQRFYRLLAGQVEVHASDDAELAVAERRGDGTLDLTVARRAKDGEFAEPFFRRHFARNETKEVRLFLGQGADSVRIRGEGGPLLRVIGTPATSVDREGAGGVRVYRDRAPYQPPDSLVGIRRAPRDWGSLWRFNPVLASAPEVGLVVGIAPSLTTFGFRQDPYASRIRARAVYGTSASEFRVDLRGDFRREASPMHFVFDTYFSGLEVVRYFGFGNATTSTAASDFYRVKQHQLVAAPSLAWSPSRRVNVLVGPILKHASTDLTLPSLVAVERPYGSGDFTQLGARTAVDLDTRDVPANPSQGVHLAAGASVYPGLFDVTSTFGEVHGEAATYLSAALPLRPTLALRAGAQQIWGPYPFHEAAFLGGASTVRGLRERRYIGDASVYGNAELRLRLTRMRLVLPATLGVFGLADGGRVFLDGESSDKWHYAAGGGLWLAFLSPANTLSVALARGEGRTAFYFRTGFMF